MRKLLVMWAMVLPALISCGGGGGAAVNAVPVAAVSTAVLTSCASDQLLSCLAGKVSFGKDATGAECGVKFSSNGFDIVSLLLNRNVHYQPANVSAQNMSYAYQQAYSADTGALALP